MWRYRQDLIDISDSLIPEQVRLPRLHMALAHTLQLCLNSTYHTARKVKIVYLKLVKYNAHPDELGSSVMLRYKVRFFIRSKMCDQADIIAGTILIHHPIDPLYLVIPLISALLNQVSFVAPDSAKGVY